MMEVLKMSKLARSFAYFQDSNNNGFVLTSMLESQCKLLIDEKQQLEAMLIKLRQEYEIETKYLKNQVDNERDRQIQWKDLYFKAHAELVDLKRRHQVFHAPPLHVPVAEMEQRWSRRDRNDSSDCQDSEQNLKKEDKQLTPHPIFTHPHNIDQLKRPSSSSIVMPRIKHREEEQRPPLHVIKRPFPRSISSQVFKPELIPQGMPLVKMPDRSQLQQSYFRCPICKIYYDTEQKLHFHMELHNEVFLENKTSSMQQQHQHHQQQLHSQFPERYKSPVEQLICSECNQSFSAEDEYRRHLLSHVFKCRYCGITVDSEINFIAHMKSHGNNNSEQAQNPFTCFVCKKQFAHAQFLTAHLLSHPDERIFTCSECGKQFARKGHLTRHMAIHTAYRPYSCKDCGKSFAHRTHLRRHEIVHSGVRPYKCKLCEQAFSRNSSLSRHYFIHTPEKPFVCPVCDKGFNRKGRLRNHLKIHIREGYPELSNYVIERRPITKEFIERMNNVSSTEDGANTESIIEPQKYLDSQQSRELISTQDQTIKEETDESSSSESEVDEAEGELSEEISYCEPIKVTEPNNNTIVSMYHSSTTVSSGVNSPVAFTTTPPTMSNI